MAKNIIVELLGDPMTHMDLVSTVPAANTTTLVPASGTAFLAGNVPAVAEATIDPVTGYTPGCTSCIAELAVVGKTTGGGNAAISAGDLLYMQTDGTIDKNTTGSGAIKFGTAFGNSLLTSNNLGTDTRSGQLVASGATTTIRVWVGKIN